MTTSFRSAWTASAALALFLPAAQGGGSRRPEDAVGLHGGVQAALVQLPGFRREGRRGDRPGLRAVQQRRRTASGPHLRLLLPRQRRLAGVVRQGTACREGGA